MLILAPDPKVEWSTGFTIAMAGRALRIILTGAETAVDPRSSVARAVSVLLPAGALVHVNVNGEVADSPSLFVPLEKNSTLATAPSASAAFTVITTLVGVSTNSASLIGLVIAIVGRWLSSS